MKSKICFLLLLGLVTSLQAQEICDNAIDDDGDGLIDLNDVNDCNCNLLIPSSLIPNPSFEDKTCCPDDNAMLNCAVGWVQASEATSDYVHTCDGYLGHSGLQAVAPQPFPDGDGAVGFKDGSPNNANYKEYVGACLTEPMEIGASYRIDFFVGFQDNVPGHSNFDIALFASTQCANLPFGGSNKGIGCPLNVGTYTQMGQQSVSGSNEWVNVVFEFVADRAYEVIVLGPSCAANPNFIYTPYFYVDRLTLAGSSEFGIPYESISGSVCENDLVLQAEEDSMNTYQWYQDGVAMLGETRSSLKLTSVENTEGIYRVAITTPEGCKLYQPYHLRIPPYYAPLEANICEGEQYIIETDTFTTTGYYEILLDATDGCDSIIQFNLEVNEHTSSNLSDSFCAGEEYTFLDINTSTPGIYQTSILNAAGCDSLITIDLSVIDRNMELDLVDTLTIDLGQKIDLTPTYISANFVDLLWFDKLDNVLGDEVEVLQYQPVSSTMVYLEAFDAFGCGAVDSVYIQVLPDYGIYVPNAFSPNGDGLNDFFQFYPSNSLAQVYTFAIFDRWGGLVYKDENITEVINYQGWNGMVNGKMAPVGMYCYILQVQFLDGREALFSGDVNLLR